MIAFYLLIIVCMGPVDAYSKNESLNFQVVRSDYTFSSVFDMANEKVNFGSVVKSIFHITTHYDSYDRYGLYEGQGICRLVTLGLIYPWATKIDIYNLNGIKMGMIDGQVLYSEPVIFAFYDAEDHQICLAYLDQNGMGFVLTDPENPGVVFARLKRHALSDNPDHWDISVYHPDRLPLKFVKIFAAFVCDKQNKFKPEHQWSQPFEDN